MDEISENFDFLRGGSSIAPISSEEISEDKNSNFSRCKFRTENMVEYMLPACCPGRAPTEKALGFFCKKLSINNVSKSICESCSFFDNK